MRKLFKRFLKSWAPLSYLHSSDSKTISAVVALGAHTGVGSVMFYSRRYKTIFFKGGRLFEEVVNTLFEKLSPSLILAQFRRSRKRDVLLSAI